MTDTAKIFWNGRSQAVRLPAAYRFDAAEVYIQRDAKTGNVILSQRPTDWGDFFDSVATHREENACFLLDREPQPPRERSLF